MVDYVGMTVVCKYDTEACFGIDAFLQFSQSAHIAYFFPHKLAFSTAILILFAFYYLGLLGFVNSTTWLPTEWQQSIHVSGPMWNEMGTIFPRHIWCLYGFQKNAT